MDFFQKKPTMADFRFFRTHFFLVHPVFKTALQMKIFVDKCPMKILCLMFKFMKYCENNREIVLPPLLFTPPTSDIKTELWNKVGKV